MQWMLPRPYFCQERRYEYYGYAKPVEENDAVRHFSKVAKELSVVLPISFYERDKNRLFNTVAILDADGENLGIYRKTHIPDDHYYQEKFYFTPGGPVPSSACRPDRPTPYTAPVSGPGTVPRKGGPPPGRPDRRRR